MESTVFYITLFIVIIANLIQCYKIIKTKSSLGVSIDAYYLTTISLISLLYFSSDYYIKIISFIEIILTIFSIYLIILYKSNNFKLFNFNIEFNISLICSLFLIFGISQAIESFKTNYCKSNVSISAYILWGILNFLLIYLSSDIYIIIALSISNFLYLYIIIVTLKCNYYKLSTK